MKHAIDNAANKFSTRHDDDNVADIPKADVTFGSHDALHLVEVLQHAA